MIVIPAIVLERPPARQAKPAKATEVDNPRVAIRSLVQNGFSRIYVADRDPAIPSRETVRDILLDRLADIQVDTGPCSSMAVREAIAAGAHSAVVSLRSLRDLDILEEITAVSPQQAVLAIRVRGRRVSSPLWSGGLAPDIFDLIQDLSDLDLAGILLTAADAGNEEPSLALVEDVVEVSNVPVLVARHASHVGHLRALEERGVAGAIVGMSGQASALDPWMIAHEFVA